MNRKKINNNRINIVNKFLFIITLKLIQYYFFFILKIVKELGSKL